MVAQKYRWDFIGLSTDEKPTSETSDKVVNGSTYYCSDTSKLYVYCDGTWYERKPLGGGGGTSDFNDLSNRPKYNGSEMSGSTDIPEVVTYSDFTGTDGTTAGTAGLVPAPATTDAGKFLKADGTWDTAGGGGPTILSTTDYDYPENDPISIALWKLAPGWYELDKNETVRYSTSSNSYAFNTICNNFLILRQKNTTVIIFGFASQWNKAVTLANVWRTEVPSGTASSSDTTALATLNDIYADPETKNRIRIGSTSSAIGIYSIALGGNASGAINASATVSLGNSAAATADGAIALGTASAANQRGEMNIGSQSTSYGYNNSNYRLLTGLYDPQSAHDAATKGYVDGLVGNVALALNAINNGTGA